MKRLSVILFYMVMGLTIFVLSEYAAAGGIQDNGNGTITDTGTHLMWKATDNGADINWHEAVAYCRNYTGGGYNDWRMPTVHELYSLCLSGRLLAATIWANESKTEPRDAQVVARSCSDTNVYNKMVRFRALPVRNIK